MVDKYYSTMILVYDIDDLVVIHLKHESLLVQWVWLATSDGRLASSHLLSIW